MKEYLKNKYKKAKQFSIAGGISEYDWLRFEAIRKQANADRLGEVFKRLTPPFASNIRLSTAEFESLDLISDGPIEGFFNSKGESCHILEASYYDDTVIAEPGVSKVTFDNLTYEKISRASSEFKEFVTGKLDEYIDDLKHRFVHKNGAKSPQDLEAFGSDFIKPNSEYNINPYNLDTFRGGYLAAKASIDEALNETTPTDVRKCDATIAWNPGLDNNNNLVTTLGKGINSEGYYKRMFGNRKSPSMLRKIYYPNYILDKTNVQEGGEGEQDIWRFNPNNPMLYQGNYSFNSSIRSDGSIDAAWCTRAFFDVLTNKEKIDGNDDSFTWDEDWLAAAFEFGETWKGPDGLYDESSDGPPSKFIYSFTPGSEIGEGLKEPVIDSIAEKITNLGEDYYKSEKFYNSETGFRNWNNRANFVDDFNGNAERIGGFRLYGPTDNSIYGDNLYQIYAINETTKRPSFYNVYIYQTFQVLIVIRYRNNKWRIEDFGSTYTYWTSDNQSTYPWLIPSDEWTKGLNGAGENPFLGNIPLPCSVTVVDDNIGSKDCVKLSHAGRTLSVNLLNPFTGEDAGYGEDVRTELKKGESYRITGEVYIPSTNAHINSFRFGPLYGGESGTITSGNNGVTTDTWTPFNLDYTQSSERDGPMLIKLRTDSSDIVPYTTPYPDFIGLRNFEIKKLEPAKAFKSPKTNYGYLQFAADDFFGGDNFVEDFDLSFSLDSGSLSLQDENSLSYSFPELTGFDLATQGIKESYTFEYYAIHAYKYAYNDTPETLREEWPWIVTGNGAQYTYGTELKESRPNKYKGAFLFPVYLGEDLIPLNSDQTIDLYKIFISGEDSAQVSGNKLQSGIDYDYDVFGLDSSINGSGINYLHIANPKVNEPDILVSEKNIGLRVKEKVPTLFNFTNVDLDYVLGDEVQKPLENKQVTEISYNKSLYGPSNPNVANVTTIDSDGFRTDAALNTPDFQTVSTTSRDVEETVLNTSSVDQSNWMNDIALDQDEFSITHLVDRRCIDSVKICFVLESLSEQILQRVALQETTKYDAANITFRIEFSFEGVPESNFTTIEHDISYYGMVQNPYGVETEEFTLPSYDDIIDEYPNETKKSLAEKYKRKIVIRKLDFETTSLRINRDARLYSVKEIISERFNYPYSAIVKNRLDARTFSEVPRRTYNVRLKKINVPSNYFPLDAEGRDRRFIEKASDLGTRKIYNGDWDGSFKIAWTDNPAWILYDLLINNRYGIGSRLDDLEDIDIFNLYKIGRYCDAVDDNGNFVGVDDGLGGLEPRYSCNVLFEASQNAFEKITEIASVFNGMPYWANGTINFFADEPKEVSAFFNNGNVFDGIFNYQDTSTSAHFNVADVVYLDKKDNYNQKIETVEFEDGRREDGPKRRTVTARGATSRGQARRLGRYILYSNKLEREIVNFKTSSEALMLSVGDIIEIQDELKNFEINYGKALEINSDNIIIENTINSESILINNTGAFVYVPTGRQGVKDFHDIVETGGFIGSEELEEMKTVQVQKIEITGVEDLTSGIKLKLNDTNNHLQHIPTGSFVNIELENRQNYQYRVLSITPEENNLYHISATEYNSGKFAFIEDPESFEIEEESLYNIGIPENTVKTLSEPEGFSTSVVTVGGLQRINFNISGNVNGNEEAYEVTTLYPNAAIDKKRIEKQSTLENGFIKTTGSIQKVNSYGTYTFEVRSVKK